MIFERNSMDFKQYICTAENFENILELRIFHASTSPTGKNVQFS